MKVVYHKKYETVYSGDPASAPGRMESVLQVLGEQYHFVDPARVSEDDIRLVHSESHLAHVRSLEVVYEIAMIAVGGAIKASELAMNGEPAFALVRPPGHHASPNSSWGFCYFNNVAIAIEKLRSGSLIDSAVILDFDLHFGDGTSAIFNSVPEVDYYHAPSVHTVESVRSHLIEIGERDIIAVSAGFDRHEADWGKMLKTEDYRRIGEIVRDYAKRNTKGRRFAVLEGGYNHDVLGLNVREFLEGME